MILNEKYSLFLVKWSESVGVILSKGLSLDHHPFIGLLNFTNDGRCVPIGHSSGPLRPMVNDVFTLDKNGAVQFEIAGPNKYTSVSYKAESPVKMLTEEIGLQLFKRFNGTIILAAVDKDERPLHFGNLLAFFPDGYIERLMGIDPSFFKVDSRKRIQLYDKEVTVMGYKASRIGNEVTIGCLKFNVDSLNAISRSLKSKHLTSGNINIGSNYYLHFSGDKVQLANSCDQNYNRAKVAKTLDSILKDD